MIWSPSLLSSCLYTSIYFSFTTRLVRDMVIMNPCLVLFIPGKEPDGTAPPGGTDAFSYSTNTGLLTGFLHVSRAWNSSGRAWNSSGTAVDSTAGDFVVCKQTFECAYSIYAEYLYTRKVLRMHTSCTCSGTVAGGDTTTQTGTLSVECFKIHYTCTRFFVHSFVTVNRALSAG